MIKKFEVGKMYTASHRANDMYVVVMMEPMYDGQPRECVSVGDLKKSVYGMGQYAEFKGIERRWRWWWWALEDMDEVLSMEKMRKIKEELMGNGI